MRRKRKTLNRRRMRGSRNDALQRSKGGRRDEKRGIVRKRLFEERNMVYRE